MDFETVGDDSRRFHSQPSRARVVGWALLPIRLSVFKPDGQECPSYKSIPSELGDELVARWDEERVRVAFKMNDAGSEVGVGLEQVAAIGGG